MSETTFLELLDHVGIEPSYRHHPDTGEIEENPSAGEPGPLVEIGVQIPVPVMVGSDVGTETRTAPIQQHESLAEAGEIKARIIPGTRIVETTAPAVVNVLISTGHYQQCDPPPSTTEPTKHKPKRTPSTDTGQES